MTGRPGLTEAIAEHACGADPGAAPPGTTDLALRAVIDTAGVAVAARRDPGFTTLLGALRTEVPAGRSTVLPTGERTSPAAAALLNGGAAHALDFDDVADQVYGHPSAVLVPALLALAESEGRSGPELLAAYLVGFDVMIAVAAGMDVRAHYGHGWHSTATIGALGATAAAARLLGCDPDRTRHALGIAASTASGSRQNFGTMTKPLHPGLAARDAVLAASLARAGFTADPDQLEAPLGYFAMYAGGVDDRAVRDALVNPWQLHRTGLNVKKYACCYNTHRTADAVLALVREEEVRAAEVAAVHLTLEPGGFDPLIHRRPRTGLQGKFSPEHVLATALVDRGIALDSFRDEAVLRPEVRRIVPLVTREESAVPPFGSSGWEFAYAAVEVETTSGRSARRRVDVPRGDHRDPLDERELEAKLRDCVDSSGSGWSAGELLAALHRLGEPGAGPVDLGRQG